MSYPKNSDFTITLEQLLEDLAQAENNAEAVSEANGEHRANLKTILDERGYHKKAFADFRAMHAMSDSKFADYWRTFAACYEAYKEEAESRIRDMVDKAEAETDDMEAAMGEAAE